MTRIKRGIVVRKRHNKIRRAVKGYRMKTTFKKAKTAMMKAGLNAYKGRKLKKRDFRALWITRINAACKAHGMNYSRFIEGLTRKAILIDRKILADLAAQHPEVFKVLVEKVKV